MEIQTLEDASDREDDAADEPQDGPALAIEDIGGGPDDGYVIHTEQEREVARCVLLNIPLGKLGYHIHDPIEFEVWTTSFCTDSELYEDDHHTSIHILFDGASHQSKMPRAWICCRNPLHNKCYKYVFLHRHASVRDAVIWLTAWVMMGLSPSLPKHGYDGHLKLPISTGDISAVEPYVPTEICDLSLELT
jgi:hypothetical protein